ncbi:MAG TPA: PEP/pyruvate-binding domain-containing protein [Gaiellaceae bacterium]|nr:PEP/pyruvate-binding domain-containing protein [Gaiellaceae bacterium]
MTTVPLADARDGRVFGGKAVQLGAAIRAGLPVPDGIALAEELVEAVARGDQAARALLRELCARLTGPLAVRSSAIGEDSVAASFAGQHATFLNVQGVTAVIQAVGAVWSSASSQSALAYRQRVGVEGPVRMGVVVQRLVAADVAGVLFTCDPVTGADELVIEASWGLGEAVVQGLVVPDLYRVARSGEVLARRPGSKHEAVRLQTDGDTRREPVEPELVETLCLPDTELRALVGLASRCEEVFGPGPHDIEWAFETGSLYLLQRRPVTAFPRATSRT